MIKSLIQQDSYWYVEEGEDSKIKALCALCAKKQNKGWRWEGRLGYGNYDLFCASCKNAIHIREEHENKNNNKDK